MLPRLYSWSDASASCHDLIGQCICLLNGVALLYWTNYVSRHIVSYDSCVFDIGRLGEILAPVGEGLAFDVRLIREGYSWILNPQACNMLLLRIVHQFQFYIYFWAKE